MSVVLKRCIYMLVVEFGIGMVIITIFDYFFFLPFVSFSFSFFEIIECVCG